MFLKWYFPIARTMNHNCKRPISPDIKTFLVPGAE
jgi:hypothetical protein